MHSHLTAEELAVLLYIRSHTEAETALQLRLNPAFRQYSQSMKQKLEVRLNENAHIDDTVKPRNQ
jgi:hypothetical protein